MADLDLDRVTRRGYAEAVYCEGKTPEQVALIAAEVGRRGVRTLFTRAGSEHAQGVSTQLVDAAYDQTITARAVARRQGWDGMTAVKDGRVLPLPEDILITRPGPRIVDGLEALARAIHPEAFQ